MALRVVLADDHAVVRAGLKLLLEAEPDIEVVAEAGDGEAAVRYCLGHKPDVLVLDLTMPGRLSGLDAIPEVRKASPDTRIVVLTMQEDPEFARRALGLGAAGYLLKEAADTELVDAVRRVAVGETYLHPRLGASLAAAGATAPDPLTDREREVLRLIALGHTNTEIGSKLYLSTRTVESHRAHIQRKLGRTARAELVAYALETGLLSSDSSRST